MTFYNGIHAENNLLVHVDLICPMYVVFYNKRIDKNNLLALIDVICPVYVFYDKISAKNNVSAHIYIYIFNMSNVHEVFYNDIYNTIITTCLNLKCPVYVVFC